MENKIVNFVIMGLLLLTIIFNIVQYKQQMNLREQQTCLKTAVEESKNIRVSLPDELKEKVEAAITAYQNDLKERQNILAKQVKATDEQNRTLMTKQQKCIDELLKTFAESLKTRDKQHEKELAARLQGIDKAQKVVLREIAQTDKGIQEKVDKAISTFTNRFSGVAIATFAEIKKENRTHVDQAMKEIATLAKQKISGNEVAAREAHEKAQEYVKKNELTMAKLYCLNAINHAPNKKTYFETLINIDKAKGTSSTQAELDGIRSVLELGLYQVDSKDIPDMMKMLAYINGKLKNISNEVAKSQIQEEQRKCAEALASLKEDGKYAWNTLAQGAPVASVALVRERLAVLDSLSSVELSSEDAAFCRQEIDKTNAFLGYLVAMVTIDNALTEAENLLDAPNPQLPAISSMVQSSNNILSQLWNINFNLLPRDARAKAIAQASRIARIEGIFNKKKSAPAMAEINRIYQEHNGTLGGNRTQKINKIQEGIKKIIKLMPEIYDLDNRRDAEMMIGDLTDKAKEYGRERYEGYQMWAVKKCNEAFTLYRSWTRVDEDDAERVVNEHLLEIDPACLTPAVSRIYQDVLAKQFAEMGWKKIAEMESQLATSTKKTIEDCPDEE